MIDVWRARRNAGAADALVSQLQAEGKNARPSNAQHFRADQIDRDVVKAYHDGSQREIPQAYEDRGIPCELIPGTGGGRVDDAPKSDGYRIEHNAPWYSVVGPEGKVGKSVRSEEEAEAILAGVTDADD